MFMYSPLSQVMDVVITAEATSGLLMSSRRKEVSFLDLHPSVVCLCFAGSEFSEISWCRVVKGA